MNALLTVLVSSIASVTAGAAQPPFHFDAKVEVPALGILDGARDGLLSGLSDRTSFVADAVSKAKPAPRPESKLPVIAPNPDVAYKMRIVAPDESLDPKAVVNPPEAEPVR